MGPLTSVIQTHIWYNIYVARSSLDFFNLAQIQLKVMAIKKSSSTKLWEASYHHQEVIINGV